MPPPPEFGDAPGDIGVVEVAHELKAQHPSQAYRHIRIAGEVKVDLDGKGQHAQPGPGHGQVPRRHGLVALPQHAHVVGDEHLFSQADDEHLDAGGKLLHGAGPAVDLISQILVFDDRAGDQLGEQGNEGAEVDQRPLGPGVPPVDIDGVAHGLEGVKGDADGQMDVQDRHEVQPHRLKGGGQKVPVFKKAQQRQVEKHRRRHRPAGASVVAPGLTSLHQHPMGVVDQGGSYHDDHIDPLAPGIKEQAYRQKGQIPPLQRDRIVEQQGQ